MYRYIIYDIYLIMKALLVIDWQKEYIDSSSDYFVNSSLENETKSLNSLIEKCRRENFLIIFVKHNETEGMNFLHGSKNAELIDSVDVQNTDILMDKYQISSFYRTNLEKVLEDNKVDELYILGILTNLCVRGAVSDAYDRGFDIKVIEDLCISFNSSIHKFTIDDLKETRPEVEFVSSTEV